MEFLKALEKKTILATKVHPTGTSESEYLLYHTQHIPEAVCNSFHSIDQFHT